MTSGTAATKTVKVHEHGMKMAEKGLEKGLVEFCLSMKCNLALCLKG